MMNPLYPKGVRKMKPTKKHRPALWEGILGTVHAYNGIEEKYFDYDYEAALKFAGVNYDRDPRLHKVIEPTRYNGDVTPPNNKLILWILK